MPTRLQQQATRHQNKSFPAFGSEENMTNKGKIQLPVDVVAQEVSEHKLFTALAPRQV